MTATVKQGKAYPTTKATAKQWKRYQAVRASLEPDQQNVLSEIEFYMANTEPGVTLVNVFNDRVDALRGRFHSPTANQLFLLELGIVDISAPNAITQTLFDGVRLYDKHGLYGFTIRLSDYFSEVIGAYIRDKEGV